MAKKNQAHKKGNSPSFYSPSLDNEEREKEITKNKKQKTTSSQNNQSTFDIQAKPNYGKKRKNYCWKKSRSSTFLYFLVGVGIFSAIVHTVQVLFFPHYQ